MGASSEIRYYIMLSTLYSDVAPKYAVDAVDNFSTTSRIFLLELRIHGISILTTNRVRWAFDRQNDKEPSKRPREAVETWMTATLE